MYKAKIDVTLKKSVLDPQGKTVLSALHGLGFDSLMSVRVGKFVEVLIDVKTEAEAAHCVKAMCDKLLVNAVIEEYAYLLESVERT